MPSVLEDMTPDLIAELAHRGERRTFGGYGIRTADAYVRGLVACADDEVCSRMALPEGFSWDPSAMLKLASERLVYSNEDMRFDVMAFDGEMETMAKAAKVDLPPRTLMTFENYVTTPLRDRDGDILRSEGAIVDPSMPLLWHHMPPMPVGKMLAVLSQNKKGVKVLTALIDSELGNDAAALIEFGALRISHGFRPLEYEPMKDGGYDISKFEIMEESLVTVPSNVQAIITAFSRGKLHDPLVKSWARSISDSRPVQVTGATLDGDCLDCDDKDVPDPSDAVQTPDSEIIDPASEAEPQSIRQPSQKSAVPYEDTPASDSYEWDGTGAVKRMRSWCGGPASEDMDWAKYRRGFGFVRGDGDNFGSYILPHHDVSGGRLVVVRGGVAAAVAAINGGRGGVDLPDADRQKVFNHLVRHYRDQWPDDEEPELRELSDEDNDNDEGKMVANMTVGISLAEDARRLLDELELKSGRVLSAKNKNKLAKASDLLQEVLASSEVQGDDGDDDKRSMIAEVLKWLDGSADLAEVKAIHELLGREVARQVRAKRRASVRMLLSPKR